MIFCFSATGNSLWAAQQLAEATGERLISMSSEPDGACRYELQPGERIGFVFPVHAWRPPRLVRAFVQRLSIAHAQGHFCYVVVTAGDDIGETVSIFSRLLAHAVGVEVQSAFSLRLPNTYVGLPFMDVDGPQVEQRKWEEARRRMPSVASLVAERRTGVADLHRSRWPRINSRLLGAAFERWLISDAKFRVDGEKCRRCGFCVRACPTRNMAGGPGQAPQWKHSGRCLTCFACYHRCPAGAIDFGRWTRHKGQYGLHRE